MPGAYSSLRAEMLRHDVRMEGDMTEHKELSLDQQIDRAQKRNAVINIAVAVALILYAAHHAWNALVTHVPPSLPMEEAAHGHIIAYSRQTIFATIAFLLGVTVIMFTAEGMRVQKLLRKILKRIEDLDAKQTTETSEP